MPILHALFNLLGVLALLTTLPLVLELLVLSLAALFPPRRLPTSRTPLRLAVIIPAHNEQQLIASCISSILASSPSVQVQVVAHNCTDATAERARAAGANVLPFTDSVGGKGNALHHGFTHALASGADAVLVIDADSTVSPNLIPAVTEALAGGSHALQCRYSVANASTPRTRLLALAFLGINVLRPRGRSRLGLSCGIFGNGFALTAETLRRVPYLANSVVEDLEYHLHLIRAGVRVDFLDSATVLGEMPDNTSASSTQRARWEGGRILMRRQWTRPLLADVLCGHLRLLEPLLDLRALPLASNAMLLLLVLLLPVFWAHVYAVAGLLTFALYVLAAASLGPQRVATLRALLAVPAYALWKLAMIPRTRLAARHNAAWVRTQRNQPDTPAAGRPAIDPPPPR